MGTLNFLVGATVGGGVALAILSRNGQIARLKTLVESLDEPTETLLAAVAGAGGNSPPQPAEFGSIDMPADLSPLEAKVTKAKGAMKSATVLIVGFKAATQAAVDAALANGVTPEQLVPFTDLITEMDATTDELAAAVAANP